MATTTNYSWTTPDDTDLVKDGASAIRTLGSSADTTVKALNPGTTAGDVDYYTSSTAKARVGIGTNGQVLTSNGSVPGWATPSSGGMTLLSTTTLSGATTTISGISGSYNNLQVIAYGLTNSTFNGDIRIALNGSATGVYALTTNDDGTTTALRTNVRIELFSNLRTNADNVFTLNIYNYASTTTFKSFNGTGVMMNANSVVRPTFTTGAWSSTSALTSLVFSNGGGNWATGTVLVYGVK